jgi:hypothetical protein
MAFGKMDAVLTAVDASSDTHREVGKIELFCLDYRQHAVMRMSCIQNY